MEYRLIEDHRGGQFRSGESAVVELRDGRLLLMYSAYRGDGNADHSPADILARISADGGLTWSDATEAFLTPKGALNATCVSLLRLADGRIGCVFAIKWTTTHCVPHWTVSPDEGASWAEPQPMTGVEGYFCINNDRLVQLSDGTLVIPYAQLKGIVRHFNDKELLKEFLNGWCGLLYSENGGETWEMPDHARRFCKEWYTLPDPLVLETMPKLEQQAVREKYDVFQEPGVVELKDGRLLMWVRSLSHVYYSISDGKSSAWSDYTAIPGMNVSCSPQTIKRVPASGDLVMIYNDRGNVPFGSPTFQDRTPLSVAISKDDGQTWIKFRPLEPDQNRNYCYVGLLFFSDKFLATYYESTEKRGEDGSVLLREDGSPQRRNLASLKACLGLQRELIAEER